jgi:hypothetical protein
LTIIAEQEKRNCRKKSRNKSRRCKPATRTDGMCNEGKEPIVANHHSSKTVIPLSKSLMPNLIPTGDRKTKFHVTFTLPALATVSDSPHVHSDLIE